MPAKTERDVKLLKTFLAVKAEKLKKTRGTHTTTAQRTSLRIYLECLVRKLDGEEPLSLRGLIASFNSLQ